MLDQGRARLMLRPLDQTEYTRMHPGFCNGCTNLICNNLGGAGTTGHPVVEAKAVSPPAVEKASGKFEAPNTATGPIGRWINRRSGRGAG